MTPVFFVGFEIADSTEMIDPSVGSVVFGSTPANAHGGGLYGTRYVTISGDGATANYCSMQDLETYGAWKNLAYSPLFIEFALNVVTLPTVGQSEEILSVYTALVSGFQKLALRINSHTGGHYHLDLYDRDGVLLASGTTELATGGFYWVGLTYTDSSGPTAADGTYTVQLCAAGGTPAVEYSGTNGKFRLVMGGVVYSGNRVRRATSAFSIRVDDVVFDSEGFNGESYVVVMMPTGQGNYNQWVGDYTAVDEQPPDGVDYIYEHRTGRKESYVCADLPSPAAGMVHSILAVKGYWQSLWELFTSGSDILGYFIRSAAVDYSSDDDWFTDSDYGFWTPRQVLWRVNPAASTAWAVSAVNVLEVGIHIVSDFTNLHVVECCGMSLHVLFKEVPTGEASDQGCYTLGG